MRIAWKVCLHKEWESVVDITTFSDRTIVMYCMACGGIRKEPHER